MNTEEISIQEEKSPKSKTLSRLVGTFFRNALRSNLDLTSLADTKAGILISINGFILTVSVTASGFAIHNSMMTYAFISIILTSLGSIILAVLAVKPREKEKLIAQEHLDGYESLLYYQDMADMTPQEYKKAVNKVIYKTGKSKNEMISHLHILSSEIKKKYYWLTRAYTFFSIGLIVSAFFIIYALIYVANPLIDNTFKHQIAYKKEKFYNIFEPSGATTLPDGKVLIVEDDSNAKSLQLLEIDSNENISEIGSLYLRKKMKKFFKKSVRDLEAVTSNANTVYAITSHSLTRSAKQKAEREKFLMFTYNDGAMESLHSYSALKSDLYSRFPKIFNIGIFTQDKINIEGLAIDGTGVLLAFRAPTVNTKALLIPIENPKKIFLEDEKPKFGQAIYLDLDGDGIRAITFDKAKHGYWIIAGSSGNRVGTFTLWFWDKKRGILSMVKNQPDIGYGEGITLVNRHSDKPALLIVDDNGKKPNKSADYIIIQRDSL